MESTKKQLEIRVNRLFAGICPRCGSMVITGPDPELPSDAEWFDHCVDYPSADYADFCLTRPVAVTCTFCKELLKTREDVKPNTSREWKYDP